MDLKPRLQRMLVQTRSMSEKLLEAFKTPNEWTHQVHAKANHALWFAGHMGVVDNFFIKLIAPQKAVAKESFEAKFGMGSKPSSNPGEYPNIDEVLAFMRERRKTLLDLLASLDEKQLAASVPPGGPPFLTDVASVFEAAVWHEGYHDGQVAVARGSLGHAPLVG